MQDRATSDGAAPLGSNPASVPSSRDRVPGPSVRSSDGGVVARIAERDGPWLHALALRVVGDQERARSVVDESVASLANALSADALTSGAAQNWLVATVHDRAVELARLMRGDPSRPVRTRPMGHGSSEAVTPEAAIDLRDAVRSALGALPEEERSALELVYFDGLLVSQAAERLCLPVQAVRTHCLDALRHLSSSVGLGPDARGRVRSSAPGSD